MNALAAGGVLLLLAVGALVSYNRFVSQRNLIANSWANIDTELRRRYDLIPNLVRTVQGYATHERQTLDAVMAARALAQNASGSPKSQEGPENELVRSMNRVMAVAEDYPDLKASENFLALQHELANTEDRIQAARRFYNGNVRDFNRRVQSFPSMIVARMGSFVEAEYFEIEEAVRTSGPPPVSL